ncbi:MAG: hypothetical protein WEA31_01450 [Pirellulales bacterium]
MRCSHHLAATLPLVALLLIGLLGCANVQGPLGRVPRSYEYEQRYIQRFDPYPENDVGPALVGARPPGFDAQLAEPARARWVSNGQVMPAPNY